MKYIKPWKQGKLRVSENGRYLRNGEHPFFYLGDTAWLLCPVCDEEEAKLYLTNRRDKGFNVIQTVLIHRLPEMPATNPAEVEKDPTDRSRLLELCGSSDGHCRRAGTVYGAASRMGTCGEGGVH